MLLHRCICLGSQPCGSLLGGQAALPMPRVAATGTCLRACMPWARDRAQSSAIKIDLSRKRPAVAATVSNVGLKAHGLVAWGPGGRFVMLDSDNAALVVVDPASGKVQRRWKVGRRRGQGGGLRAARTHTRTQQTGRACRLLCKWVR